MSLSPSNSTSRSVNSSADSGEVREESASGMRVVVGTDLKPWVRGRVDCKDGMTRARIVSFLATSEPDKSSAG